MGQGLAFKRLFAQPETAPTDNALTETTESPTIRQQMDKLANTIRNWLTENGIQTPYEIRLSSDQPSTSSSDSGNDISVQGEQAAEIRALISREPSRLSGLTSLVQSIQSLSSTFGSGAASLTVTDLDSHLTY